MSGTPDTPEVFRHFRAKMNAAILEGGKRQPQPLLRAGRARLRRRRPPHQDERVLGLVASLVLRCDEDCISDHVVRCREEAVGGAEFCEAFAVGGSIVMPHRRRAVARLGEVSAP